VHGVVVEEIRQVASGGKATHRAGAALAVVGGGRAQVGVQRRQVRVLAVAVDEFHEGPDAALGAPRIVGGVHVGHRGHGVADQGPRKRETDVGAHAATPPRGRPGDAKAAASTTAPPPGGHRYDLGRDGIGQRYRQQIAQGFDQSIGPLGSMYGQHL